MLSYPATIPLSTTIVQAILALHRIDANRYAG